jgi:hypothetical protein
VISRILFTRRKALAGLLLLLGAVAAVLPGRAPAQSITLQTIVGGLSSPVDVQSPRGDARLFVAEQNSGRIRVVVGNSILPSPFLDLGGQISFGGERGLLGLCFDPGYHQNRFFYVALTNLVGDLEVRRYRTTGWDPNLAESWSARLVITVPQPFPNHKGGSLRFGPDGHLYLGTGDGGGADDPDCVSQNLNSLLGKILRLDVRSLDSTGSYTIPPQNPFVGQAGARGEIFALGLRNPWRFGFDSHSGGLLIADVGEAAREEVSWLHLGPGGTNFGWPQMEGTLCNGNASCPPATPGCWSPALRPPVHEYTHDFWSGGCSIVGGVVYRGCALPGLSGSAWFADYCGGKVWSLGTNGWASWGLVERTSELAPAAAGGTFKVITALAEDARGELLILEQTGMLYRVVPSAGAAACQPLRARFQRLSVSQGGLQQLDLHFGSAQANRAFAVLGGASGTWPGLSLDGVSIPLNADGYLQWILSGAAGGLINPAAGLLGASGEALIDLRLPPGSASQAVGLTLHHAVLALDPFWMIVRASSNAVPLELAP